MAIEPGLDYGFPTPYVSSWADYLPSLYLSFSINKMRVTIVGFLFRSRVNTCNTSGTQQVFDRCQLFLIVS